MIVQRFLPLLNLAGCLVVAAVLYGQWSKERRLDREIESLQTRLETSRAETAAGILRVQALEGDAAQLKNSIESAAATRESREAATAAALAEQNSQMTALATAAGEQTKIWEEAIAARDAKIGELNTALTATRARLDDAVKNLKAAGAR